MFFGSECGSVEFLSKAAEYCETSEFYSEYDKKIKNGERSAASFAECLKEQGFPELSSNDILGIAYIRAINRMGSELSPVTIQRSGAGYNDINIYDGVLPSATSLRKMIDEGRVDELSSFMPESMLRIIKQEAAQERLTNISEADSAVLSLFRLSREEIFDGVAESQGGIVNRLIRASRESTSVNELLERVGTKRYTDAKLRRAMLFCLTQTKQHVLKEIPQYTTLLAANEKGRELLSKNRKRKGISVVTKPADAPRNSEQFVLSERLDTYYAVSRKNKLTADFFFQKNAYVVK
ncbi:MAG: nucleotidyltransferase family protein [Clostridia bacterium]|nr:nucleotidyltransferase family protein [Clostridia bacterium]